MAELSPKEVSDLLDTLLAEVAAESAEAPAPSDGVGGVPPAPKKEAPRKDAVAVPSVGRPRKKKSP